MGRLLLLLLLLAARPGWAQQYAIPEIPDTILDPAERLDYAVGHFWDGFNFSDTTLLRPDYAEQALVDFLELLRHASPEGRALGIGRCLAGARREERAFAYFAEEAEHYLYDPDSPLHDEQVYYDILQVLLEDTTDVERTTRWRFQQRLLGSNRVGRTATDFRYQRAGGRETTLLATADLERKPLLLLFYDPDCDHCRQTIERLAAMPMLRRLVEEERLAVLAVYTEGDEPLWEATRNQLPEEWIVGMDVSGVRDNMLYDLKAMPAIYLLDAQCHVVLKDANVAQILAKLAQF